MASIKDLEEEYNRLINSPFSNNFEMIDKEPKIKKVTFEELASKKIENPLDIRERVNWVEMRMDDLEKSLALMNKIFNDHTKASNERFEMLFQKIEKIEEKIQSFMEKSNLHENLNEELSSLKLIVNKVMSVNEEIKTKTPVFLRELEKRVDELDESVKKIKEETRESSFRNPIIIE